MFSVVFCRAEDSSHTIDDNTLAALAKEDMEHFSELYERFYDRLYKYFFFRVRSQDDAEDLVAETFELLIKKFDKFEDRGLPFAAWLFKLAHNKMVDYFQKKEKTSTIALDDIEATAGAQDREITKMDHKLLSKKLWAAIHQLPEKHQAVWGLKLTNDLSSKEIAKIVGTTEGNVNVMLHRSLAALKKTLLSDLPKTP